MYSSASCAVSGSFLIIGGIGTVVWSFLRVLWTHLRVCWDINPGHIFMYASIGSGILLPAIFLTAILVASGLSFRLGTACVPNYHNSFATFWGWMLAFVGLSCLMQLITTGYGIWIYLKSQRQGPRTRIASFISTAARQSSSSARNRESMGKSSDEITSATNTPVTPHGQSHQTLPAPTTQTRATGIMAWRQVRGLLLTQWRGIAVSILIMTEMAFFAVVFITQDQKTAGSAERTDQISAAQQWSTCLALTEGDRDMCRPFTKQIVLPQSVVLAALILLALTGSEVALLLIRKDTLLAWGHLLKGWCPRRESGKRGSDFSLTSLATRPLFHHYHGQHSAGDAEKVGSAADIGTASPLPYGAPSSAEGTTTTTITATPAIAPGRESSRRRSWLRPRSWHRRITPPPAHHWPLPREGLRPEVQETDGQDTLTTSTATPQWRRDAQGDDAPEAGRRVPLDPRARGGRGGLAMNPVAAPPAVPASDMPGRRGGGGEEEEAEAEAGGGGARPDELPAPVATAGPHGCK
jgi:hypothetical protein